MPVSAAPELSPLTRSVAACLASILELDPDGVPAPPAEHPEPWTVWRNWLAQRGLGLVPVREPRGFAWPGPWLAVLDSGVAAVAFGSPPGLVWKPLDGPETFDAVREGYLVAPADAALWAPRPSASVRTVGQVEALALATDAEAPMTLVETAVARAGHGLEGDRYFDGHGTFSNRYARGVDLTLIEAEALDGLMAPAEARRNVITRGIDLNALVGRRFLVGEVECLGQRLCEPCAHLERLTAPGTLRALVHVGGLRADVLSDGTIRAGDPVRAV
jgi:MOSC domain-containing protein YiiM